jgi:hypothetical protein
VRAARTTHHAFHYPERRAAANGHIQRGVRVEQATELQVPSVPDPVEQVHRLGAGEARDRPVAKCALRRVIVRERTTSLQQLANKRLRERLGVRVAANFQSAVFGGAVDHTPITQRGDAERGEIAAEKVLLERGHEDAARAIEKASRIRATLLLGDVDDPCEVEPPVQPGKGACADLDIEQ